MEEPKKINKGGRPRKGDDARQHLITIAVSANDLKEIIEVQKHTRQSKSDIVYDRYKKSQVVVVQKFGLSGDEMRALAIANNNLNQIARRLNTEKSSNLSKSEAEMLNVISEQLAKIRPE